MKAKDLALISIYTAMLIGGQLILSWIAGIEIVTVLLVAFCYSFGVKRSLILVNAFLWLRCIIFGFFPTVVILYIVYYNLFAIVFAFIGKMCKQRITVLNVIIVIISAALMTVLFTLFDDIITPAFYQFNEKAAKAYFISSLVPLGTQVLCSILTVALLFPLLEKLLMQIFKIRKESIKLLNNDKM